jgi:glycyl-tRNA synthetase beta chain
MKPLLFEIGTEEIPARFVTGSIQSLNDNVTSLLKESHIDFMEVYKYATPRRLAIFIEKVSEFQKERTVEILGPPKKIAFDEKGNLTAAATGFAKSQHVDTKSLKVVKTDRGEYIAAVRTEANRETIDILSETLPRLIASLQFPKSMRWGSSHIKFVRPIKWITAIYGDSKISFKVDGIKSSNMTCGHRFLSPGSFIIHDPSTYSHILHNNYVVADPEKRKDKIIQDKIIQEIKIIENESKITVHEDSELLEEVTFLVEYPTVILGNFNEEYLALPRELLITVMKSHQRYFSVEDREGNLLPHFVLVSNTKSDNNDTVRRGAERVLKARLEDAKFYYSEDQKKALWDHGEQLKDVTFQENLGSMHEKVERISHIGSFLAEIWNLPDRENIHRASVLSKADLVTGIVREFPELQGYIGMVYAKNSGEDEKVASAIYEHYMPRFAGDTLPSHNIGTIISLADRIDNITSFFLIGLLPSGSEDPYGLRRQALGIIRILQTADVTIPLDELVLKAIETIRVYRTPRDTLASEILQFLLQRLEGLFLNEKIGYDVIDAVLAIPERALKNETIPSAFNIKDLWSRVRTLSRMKEDQRFPDLLTAAKRVYNILVKYEPLHARKDLCIENSEKELFSAVEMSKSKIKGADYSSLYELAQPINTFFDSVLVMDENPEIRQNRLGLLFTVKDTFDLLGDFSKLVE